MQEGRPQRYGRKVCRAATASISDGTRKIRERLK